MPKCKECGKRGVFLKLNPDGLCLDCVTKALAKEKTEYNKMKSQASPEAFEIMSAQERLDALNLELAQANEKKKQTAAESKELEEKLSLIQGELIEATEQQELESFSLYQPRFAFAKSTDYKQKILDLRVRERNLIRTKTAAVCSTNWTVDGDKKRGKKMTEDNIKLVLRSFNNECDIAISSAKFNNFDRCKARIQKSFELLNDISESSLIKITNDYLQLKLDELALAYEYQQKKQEEKEEAAELRAQQREAVRAAKEMEEARKAAEKEKQHYTQALEKLDAQIMASPENADLSAKRNEIMSRLDDITAKLEDIDYRQANQRAGYVYIISNIGAFGENVYKIGMTRRLDPMERVYELGDASVPFFFDVHAMIFSEDAPTLENALHHAFDDRRVNRVNLRREYFNVTLDEIKEVVRKNHDKTVEFVDYPDAQQYRESLQMRKENRV